jgi:hypothetical protein
MSPLRIAAVAYFLIWGLATAAQPPAPTAPAAPPPRPAPLPSDPQAAELLQKALAAIQQLENFEARFQQATWTDSLPAEAKGVYIAGPGRILRYELTVQRGSVSGAMLIVCDGEQLWRRDRAATVDSFEVFSLAQFDEELSQLTMDKQPALEEKILKQLRRDLLSEHGFLGLTPTLEDLQQHLRWSSLKSVKLAGGGDGWELEGEWNQAAKDQIVPPKKSSDPKEPDYQLLWDQSQIGEFLPRRCRLRLEAKTLWPVQLEWLGPRPRQGEVVLSRLDWQIKPLTPAEVQERCRLTAAEQALSIRRGDFKTIVKQRLDFLVRQQQMEEEMRRRQLQQQQEPGRSPGS